MVKMDPLVMEVRWLRSDEMVDVCGWYEGSRGAGGHGFGEEEKDGRGS